MIPAAARNAREHRFGWPLVLIASATALFTALAVYMIFDKSPVTDTVAFHAVNGYANWMTHDFRMSPATPPFIRLWVTIPWVLLWRPALDLAHPSWAAADSVPFGVHFFYEQHRAIAGVLHDSSCFMVLLMALAGLGVAASWAGRLYGRPAAAAALILLAFTPTWLGYSAIVNIDIGIALFYLVTVMGFYRFLEEKGGRGFPWLGAVALGLALASKFTGVLMVPLIVAACLFRLGIRRGLLVLAGVGGVALLVIWASYFFEFGPLLGEAVPRVAEKEGYIRAISDKLFGSDPVMRERLLKWAHDVPIPLSSWVLGFAGIARSHQADYRHFFMGEWRDHQVWFHYLFSFAVKTPIPFLMLILWRLAALGRSLKIRPIDLYLLAPVTVILAATCVDTTGVGMRYLVPVIPLLSVWLSGLWGTGSRLLGTGFKQAAAAALVAWHVLCALLSFPNHIAYFNEFIGGPSQAYRYFRANDLEWGQEVKNLAKYVREHGIQRIRVRLFGVNDPWFYGIPAVAAAEEEQEKPLPEWYAISVMSIDHFVWTRDHAPVAKIGHVIWIYDLTPSGKDSAGEKAPA